MKVSNTSAIIVLLVIGLTFFGLFKVATLPVKNSSRYTPVAKEVCSVNADSLVSLINQERASLGKPTLITDSLLVASSKTKLDDMIAHTYYGHNLLDGRSWDVYYKAQGIQASGSENIGSSDISPEKSWLEFKNSPSHYASFIDSSYTRIGVSAQCVDLTLTQVTGPSENSNLIGQKVSDLTVVHLARPEPVMSSYSQCVTVCNDNSCSSSSGSGTCSWHRGIRY